MSAPVGSTATARLDALYVGSEAAKERIGIEMCADFRYVIAGYLRGPEYHTDLLPPDVTVGEREQSVRFLENLDKTYLPY